jgi:lamin tail-like protein
MHASMATAAILAAAALAGCGPDDDGGVCTGGFLAGDLVVTEVMANPEGTDEGAEWFEIYNAGDAPADLSGLVLVASRDDASDPKSHAMAAATVEPHGYFVLGNTLPEFVAPYVDYGYGNDLGDLRNAAGRLALRCGDTEIDAITYAEQTSGRSTQLDGATPPDYTTNDDLGRWCEGMAEYAAGNRGTPGGVNSVCAWTPVPGFCNEKDAMRPTVTPAVGDLVITELMPNPDAVGDEIGEWFEVTATADVDLNGLTFGREVGDGGDQIDALDCRAIGAGGRVVFARSLDFEANGMLPRSDFEFGFTLVQGSAGTPGHIYIAIGDTVLDEVTWSGSSAGVAIQLDPDLADEVSNDDEGNWCAATASYGAGDLGTPREANGQCEIAPPDGMCFDGGGLRPIVPPAAGQLRIVEWMANPQAVDDDLGEWFELAAESSFDLNGLELGRTPGTVESSFEPAACAPVEAGDLVLFAREETGNGGLPAPVGFFDFSLVNGAGGLFIGSGGVVIDQVTWSSSTAAHATQIDGTGTTCASEAGPYNGTDFGTPAAVNPACP